MNLKSILRYFYQKICVNMSVDYEKTTKKARLIKEREERLAQRREASITKAAASKKRHQNEAKSADQAISGFNKIFGVDHD